MKLEKLYHTQIQSHLLFALVILFWLWQNTDMKHWLPILISSILGIALGLIYGWVIEPVQFTDITPDALRSDYRTDYVLMVAEAFQTERSPEFAAKRLAILGSQSPAIIVEDALTLAQQSGYPAEDLTSMQELFIALEAWQPVPGANLP